MKKTFLMVALLLTLTACGSAATQPAQEAATTPASVTESASIATEAPAAEEPAAPEASAETVEKASVPVPSEEAAAPEAEASELDTLESPVEVEIPSDLVDVIIPADIATNEPFSKMDLEAARENNGWYDAKRTEDGSIVFTMTESQRDDYFKSTRESMVSGVTKTVVGSEQYPYIKSIDFDGDTDTISVVADSSYSDEENATGILVLRLLFMQARDNAVKMTAETDWHVLVYESGTENILDEYDVG